MLFEDRTNHSYLVLLPCYLSYPFADVNYVDIVIDRDRPITIVADMIVNSRLLFHTIDTFADS